MTTNQNNTNSQNIPAKVLVVEMTVVEMNVYASEYEAHRNEAKFIHKFDTTQISHQGLEDAEIWLKDQNCSLSMSDSQLLKELIEKNQKSTVHLDLDDDVVHVVIYHIEP